MSSQPLNALYWLSLLGLSLSLAIVLELIGAPAAFMLGAMIAGIGITAHGWQLKLPPTLNNIAQAIIGCLIGSSIRLDLLPHSANAAWLFASITLVVLVISLGVGIVDMPFIIAAQMFRFITVLTLGPAITRYLAQRFSLTRPEHE